jgi:tetratricopeptide (TPR) repeat protein
MGLVQTKDKNYAGAIQSFQQSIKNNKKFYDPYINLGHALDEQGLYNQSIPYYEKAIKIDSVQQTAWKNIGVAYDKMGQWQKTVELWKRANKVFPNDPAYEYNIALKLGQNGLEADAIKYLQSAARRGEPNAQLLARGRGVPF